MKLDLHCHSTRSDGSDAPAELAARAARDGVEVFAVTDHDICTAVTVAGARTIRAVEMTCDADETIHVLAYDRGGDWQALEDELATMRRARADRLRVMAERLARLGVVVEVESLLAAGRSVGRPDLARVIVESGLAASHKEAFARYLYDGGPVDVPHRVWPIADALAAGRTAGAAMSLAHPHVYDQPGGELAKRYRDDGLTGIEAFYGAYDLPRRRRWVEIADQLGLTCTGGSDWHGDVRPDLASGLGVELPRRRTAALLAWLGV